MINITHVSLYQFPLKLKFPFEISSARITHRPIFLLKVQDASGISVWSECVAKGLPNYSPETDDTAWHIISKFILPLVLNQSFNHPSDIRHLLAQHIKGNFMAKAAIEMAAWAILAEQQSKSLAELIGGTQTDIPSGISIGIQPTPDELYRHIQDAVDAGFKKIKLKMKPGHDLEMIRGIRQHFGDKLPIMLDANTAYSLEDIPFLRKFDELNVMMIEQPFRSDDLVEHAQLVSEISTPICLDETITHQSMARAAIQLKSADIINIKPGRVGGFTDAIAIHDICQQANIPVWCGGMLESGVGRAYNVALASLPFFSIPGDISPSQRYWDEDIVTPEWTMSSDGMIKVPFQKTGIGVSVNEARVTSLAEKVQHFS